MARRTALVAALATTLLLAGSAAGDPGTDKARLDARIGDLRAQAEQAAGTEGVLTTELSGLTSRVRAAEAAVATEQARLAALEASLAAERVRLAGARAEDRRRDGAPRRARAAVRRGARGARAAAAHDLRIGLTRPDRLRARDDLVLRPARQPRPPEPHRAPGRADRLVARSRPRRARADTRGDEGGTGRSRPVGGADRLPHGGAAGDAGQDGRDTRRARRRREREGGRALAGARGSCLVRCRGGRPRGSRALRSRHGSPRPRARRALRRPGAAAPAASSSGQLGWPVAGPVTSGFGSRWGRMHEGIDIAVGSGTPGPRCRGRDGRLRRLDVGLREHRRDRPRQRPLDGVRAQLEPDRRTGGRRSGRASSIALSGSTGHSTGPHVHFEVRVERRARRSARLSVR